jgi:MFS family permease
MTSNDRQVARLLVSHALAASAMSLPWPWLLALVWDTTHSPALLGLAAGARMLPYVACSWWAARIGDHLRRDVVVRATVVLRLVLLTTVPLLVWLDRPGWAVAAAAASIVAATPAYPALAAALPDAAGERADRATEALVTIEVASYVVGPAVGGLLIASPVAVAALSIGATGASLGLLRGVRLAPASHRSSASAGVAAALRRSQPIRRALALMSLLNLVDTAVGVTLLLMARGDWTGRWSPESAYGIASGALGFGALLAPALVRVGTGREGRWRAGALLTGAGVLATAVSPTIVWALAPLLLVGAASVHAESAATSVVQAEADDDVRASLFGLADACMVGAALVGALVAPTLAEASGPQLFLVGAGAAAIALVAWRLEPAGQVRPSTAVAPRSSSVSTSLENPDDESNAAVR